MQASVFRYPFKLSYEVYRRILLYLTSIMFYVLATIWRWMPDSGPMSHRFESHPIVRRLSMVIEDHDKLKLENTYLRDELDILRREYDHISKRLLALQRQLDRTNQTKDVVNLCKLLLVGSLVPAASLVLVYSLIDGSMFVTSTEL